MSRGIGVGSMQAERTARLHAVLSAAVVTVALTVGAPASSSEPSPPNRFSEAEMLDAARRAASSGESRTVNIGIPPADELRVLETRREAELKRLSEKLKRAAEARGPQPAEILTTPAWATDVVAAPAGELDTQQRSALGASPTGEPTKPSEDFGLRGHATILMVIAPTNITRTVNGPDRAADPILCVADGCYVSNGPQAPASYHSFGQSMSLGGRIGRGAGSCNHSQACVFRNVDLGSATALVQPIDLKLMRHDRREQSEVAIDTTCRMIDDRLSCSRPVRTATYTLWVLPEHLAREIGSEKLASAVGDGLRTARSAELPWFQQ